MTVVCGLDHHLDLDAIMMNNITCEIRYMFVTFEMTLRRIRQNVSKM